MDRPAVDSELAVRVEDGSVIIEPSPVYGVIGFTVHLTKEGARQLGHKLIGAATQAMRPTVNGGKD